LHESLDDTLSELSQWYDFRRPAGRQGLSEVRQVQLVQSKDRCEQWKVQEFNQGKKEREARFTGGKMSFLKAPSPPKLAALPPTPTEVEPEVLAAEKELKLRLKGAGSREKSVIAPLGFLKSDTKLKTPTLSDTLGGTFR
jgi:hypothetical protein